ncbi:hypothetical protein GOA69_16325 [Sinorhizobium meliloti]|uniref:hypothetical protein n=1 Tax=Rhizobium meliloti TaxID=382 RepID=UPI00299E3BCF|nr:hypothetical protein [Sinorhizobium meliloti]
MKSSRDVFGDDFDDRLYKVDALMRTLGISTYWIAGGYLRDREAEIAHKDIDVFLPGDEPLEQSEASGTTSIPHVSSASETRR